MKLTLLILSLSLVVRAESLVIPPVAPERAFHVVVTNHCHLPHFAATWFVYSNALGQTYGVMEYAGNRDRYRWTNDANGSYFIGPDERPQQATIISFKTVDTEYLRETNPRGNKLMYVATNSAWNRWPVMESTNGSDYLLSDFINSTNIQWLTVERSQINLPWPIY